MATQATKRGRPVEGIVEIMPYQGEWSEREYLNLIVRKLVEYTDGLIEILPMPTTSHQKIVVFLLQFLLASSSKAKLGEVLMAPLKLRIRRGKYREPDLMIARVENTAFVGEQFWTGADLVIEVVSPDNPSRDHEEKPIDYAEGKIPEYWIVDPQRQTFTVLTLRGDAYVEHGVFVPGELATSALLAGISVDVTACLAAGRPA